MFTKLHPYQMLVEMYMNDIYKNDKPSQYYFNEPIQCTELSKYKLPKCTQYVGEKH